MAIKVANAADAAAKFVQRAQAAAPAYAAGVANAGSTWEANTVQAADSWAQGVTQAVADKRFANGVSGSANKFQTNASKIGATRYGPGVANSQQTWQTATAPYLQAIANVNLPPRSAKGNPQNYARVSAVGDALRALKLSS